MTTATEDTNAIDLAEQPPFTSVESEINVAEGDPHVDAPPVHEARCGECKGTVRFQLTASGHGLMVLERHGYDIEQSFGISGGLPVCPNGHGEMTMTDEQLPVGEAFALAQERLEIEEARPPRLPFPTPPFNYEGAIHSIFETRREVARLEIKLADADERRKKAKAALDAANEELGELIDRFEEAEKDRLEEIARKQAQAEAGHPDGTNLVRCKWEEQHPGQVCPICSDERLAALRQAHPLDSEAHVEDVGDLEEVRDCTATSDALEAFGIILPILTILGWSPEDRAAVRTWATFDQASNDTPPARPAVLGTCHVAGEGRNGEAQTCTQCDAVLIGKPEDGSDPNYYAEGILVGTDCPGKAKADGHHYIGGQRKGRRKKARPQDPLGIEPATEAAE